MVQKRTPLHSSNYKYTHLSKGTQVYPSIMSFQCQVCSRRFETRRGLTVHLSKTFHPIPGDGATLTIHPITSTETNIPRRRNPSRSASQNFRLSQINVSIANEDVPLQDPPNTDPEDTRGVPNGHYTNNPGGIPANHQYPVINPFPNA